MKLNKISLGMFTGNYRNDEEEMKSLEMLCSEIIPALTHLIKEQQSVITLQSIESQQLKESLLEIKSTLDKLIELKTIDID